MSIQTHGRVRPSIGSQTAASAIAIIVTTTVLVLVGESLRHWFVLPVSFAGFLFLREVLRWLTGKIAPFDAAGFIGLIGFSMAYVGPLTVGAVRWNPILLDSPADWRPALGLVALVTVPAILIYLAVLTPGGPRQGTWPRHTRRRDWNIDTRRFGPASILAASVSIGAIVVLWVGFGGIWGINDARFFDPEAFAGTGVLFGFAESLPVVAFLTFAVIRARRGGANLLRDAVVAIILATTLALVVSGTRGSRASVVWSIVWIVGVAHYWLWPIRIKRVFAAGLVAVLLFAYAFGFYKTLGIDAAVRLGDGTSLGELEASSRRDFQSLIIGDLSRADVHAILIIRADSGSLDYALGSTYLHAVSLLTPGLSLGTPKTEVGSRALYGADPGGLGSSRVYGLFGEGLLNFGLIGVYVAFALLGVVVRWQRYLVASLAPRDSRRLLLPLMSVCIALTLIMDLDNVIYLTVSKGLLPGAMVAMSSRRVRSPLSARATPAYPATSAGLVGSVRRE